MAIITAIEVDRFHRGRVRVSVDGRPTLSLHRRSLKSLGLREGQVVDQTDLSVQALEAEKVTAHAGALDFLARQGYSARELSRRLAGRGFGEEVVQGEIARLKRAGLVDDERLAKDYVDHRLSTRPAGRRLLRAELTRRGVGRQAVEKAVARAPAGGSADELTLARESARARLAGRAARIANADSKTVMKLRKQLLDYLLRRGFSFETAEKVVREAISDRETGEGE
ncbi:MAG TPA: regulatory protein RecX [Bacillota bacterium]|jgi:regulatory protein